MKIKLPQSKILRIIQEEIELFIKHQNNEEKNGRLLDEFSSVFVEAIEGDQRLKEAVRSNLSFITENWGDTGFGDPASNSDQSNRQDTSEEKALTQLKREIMFNLNILDVQQLKSVLNQVKTAATTQFRKNEGGGTNSAF